MLVAAKPSGIFTATKCRGFPPTSKVAVAGVRLNSTSSPGGSVRNGNADTAAQQVAAGGLYSPTVGCPAQAASAAAARSPAVVLFNPPARAVLDPDLFAIGGECALHD